METTLIKTQELCFIWAYVETNAALLPVLEYTAQTRLEQVYLQETQDHLGNLHW